MMEVDVSVLLIRTIANTSTLNSNPTTLIEFSQLSINLISKLPLDSTQSLPLTGAKFYRMSTQSYKSNSLMKITSQTLKQL